MEANDGELTFGNKSIFMVHVKEGQQFDVHQPELESIDNIDNFCKDINQNSRINFSKENSPEYPNGTPC